MTTQTETPKSYARSRDGFKVAGPDGRFYESAAIVAVMEAEAIRARSGADPSEPGIGQQSQDDLDGSPSRVGGDDVPPGDDPSESAEILPDVHYRDLTAWQREVLSARYGDLDEDQQRKYDLEKTEVDMETPVDDTEPPADPTAVIGRPQAGRTSVGPEAQTAFNEERIDVENGEAAWYLTLNIREDNKEAHKRYVAADSDVKKGLIRMGKYDGKPHTIRAGEFMIGIVKSDGEPVPMNFVREPSIRKTIKKGD